MRFHPVLVSARLPLPVEVQLNAAHVPVIDSPVTVAVTLSGHSKTSPGVRVMERLAPERVPDTVPALVAVGNVADHVPPTDDPDWVSVTRAVPVPERLLVMAPVQVPTTLVEDGDVGESPSQALNATAPITHRHSTRQRL